MIIYSPLDGDALTSSIPSNPRHCFLMTRLGHPVPAAIEEIRLAVSDLCRNANYTVIDARSRVTGRDFLMKIWRLIASAPLSIGICHEDIPAATQANIYYELGVAQALGKETLLIKSPNVAVPSDFIRTEYVEFNADFRSDFSRYLDSLQDWAEHYELVADQLDRNPISQSTTPRDQKVAASRNTGRPREDEQRHDCRRYHRPRHRRSRNRAETESHDRLRGHRERQPEREQKGTWHDPRLTRAPRDGNRAAATGGGAPPRASESGCLGTATSPADPGRR